MKSEAKLTIYLSIGVIAILAALAVVVASFANAPFTRPITKTPVEISLVFEATASSAQAAQKAAIEKASKFMNAIPPQALVKNVRVEQQSTQKISKEEASNTREKKRKSETSEFLAASLLLMAFDDASTLAHLSIPPEAIRHKVEVPLNEVAIQAFWPTNSFDIFWCALYIVASFAMSAMFAKHAATSTKEESLDAVLKACLQVILRVPTLVFAATVVHSKPVTLVVLVDVLLRLAQIALMLYRMKKKGMKHQAAGWEISPVSQTG